MLPHILQILAAAILGGALGLAAAWGVMVIVWKCIDYYEIKRFRGDDE